MQSIFSRFIHQALIFSGLVPLDTVQEAMGSMGPWHIVIAVAVSLVKFPVAWHQLSIVFLAPPTNFSCIAPLSTTNESMIMKCEVDVGNGTTEKCTEFRYDKRIFRESIITQVSYCNFIKALINISLINYKIYFNFKQIV